MNDDNVVFAIQVDAGNEACVVGGPASFPISAVVLPSMCLFPQNALVLLTIG